MSDVMRPIAFKSLLRWMVEEYANQKSIFSIPEGKFYYKKDKAYFEIFGEKCETAIGPAAGPATQQAMNLAVSYLTGGRFFELKTVQILDALEVEKPCIDICGNISVQFSQKCLLSMFSGETEAINLPSEGSEKISIPSRPDKLIASFL